MTTQILHTASGAERLLGLQQGRLPVGARQQRAPAGRVELAQVVTGLAGRACLLQEDLWVGGGRRHDPS